MICIAIMSNQSKISGKLTKYFAWSYAYHIAFVDLDKKGWASPFSSVPSPTDFETVLEPL